MKYEGVCIAVSDVKTARKFYEDLFGLEVFQDYGINISFCGGLSLQQEFDWLLNIPKEKIMKAPHNMELYFEEDNFDGFIEILEQRSDIEYMGDGIKEATWGHRSPVACCGGACFIRLPKTGIGQLSKLDIK